MKILHCVLAYRGQVSVETAFSVTRDAIWANSEDHSYATFHTDISSIERARNRAVMVAIHQKADILVMQDSDCYILPSEPGSLLASCLTEMRDRQAAACGAVFVCRNLERMNANPAEPGEVYDGEVGTGFMVLDMDKLKSMPLPWFRHVHNETLTDTEVGEDVWFCRKVAEHGQKVVVNYDIPTGHSCEAQLRCVPKEIAEGAVDVVRISQRALALVKPHGQ